MAFTRLLGFTSPKMAFTRLLRVTSHKYINLHNHRCENLNSYYSSFVFSCCV
jgi:hypothetical protein